MALITVTGTLKDPSGTALNGGKVTFTLANLAGNLPYVSGTTILVPVSVTVASNSSGAFTVTLYGNDAITPANSVYNVNFNDMYAASYSLTGSGPIDLDSTIPNSSTPAPSGALPTALLTSNNTFSASNTFTGAVTLSGSVTGVVPLPQSTVTFSATPTFDATNKSLFTITLTGNVTSSTLSNAVAGQIIVLKIVQDATGGRTFVYPTNVKGGMDISTVANAINTQAFIFDGTNAYALGPGAIN